MTLLAALRAVVVDDKAVAIAEYALVLGVLAVLSLGALSAIATAANATLNSAYSNFSNLQENPPP